MKFSFILDIFAVQNLIKNRPDVAPQHLQCQCQISFPYDQIRRAFTTQYYAMFNSQAMRACPDTKSRKYPLKSFPNDHLDSS